MTTTQRPHPPPHLSSCHMGCLARGPTGRALPSKSTRAQADEWLQWTQETTVTALTLIKCAMQPWLRTWKGSYQNFSLDQSVWLVIGRCFTNWDELLSLSCSMGGRTTMQLALTSNLPLDKVVVVDVSPVNQVSLLSEHLVIFRKSRNLT